MIDGYAGRISQLKSFFGGTLEYINLGFALVAGDNTERHDSCHGSGTEEPLHICLVFNYANIRKLPFMMKQLVDH
jgi:hypothetical protein